MEQLLDILRHVSQLGGISRTPKVNTLANSARHQPHYSALVYGSALESHAARDHYSWYGLRRGGEATHPYIIFQYTLSGWGYYREDETLYKVTPGMAFIAHVPSNHHYYFPSKSDHWSFFWLLIRHPYIVSRFVKQIHDFGALLHIEADSILIKRAVEVLEHIYAPAPYDPFAEEESLFRFLIEYERSLFNRRYPQAERERLLQHVRGYVLQTLPHAVGVETLAEIYNMSRSAFSHHFKTITGHPPAQYMTRVRLEEATSQLINTHQRLEDIALATGFANATHFCKAFRRHFQLSPTAFRHQMRSSSDRLTQ